jgi:thiosulfate/3-mercaptopyruvate sulfurtransferase
MAAPARSPLTSAAKLAARLESATPPALLDVRWALGDEHGREHHLAGHIPGAVFVDLDRELAAPPAPALGRHPLPALGALEAAARRWGVREGGSVVAYDDSGGLAAARAWWLLEWAGVADVRILNGGLAAWTRSGRALESGEVVASPGDVRFAHGGRLAVLDTEAVAALACRGLLLDARAAERYRGEVEPVDLRAGHIPGAVSAPPAENLDADGCFLDAGALRRRFERLGATAGTPVGVYCGSGVTAAHEIAALAAAGFEAALFPGSWSAWCADPARPAALGARPGGAGAVEGERGV